MFYANHCDIVDQVDADATAAIAALADNMVAMKLRDVPNRLVIAPDEPSGMDCFADDRDALNDFAKYYNNAHLSDVNIIVGDDTFAAHRLILAKNSEVFDRMLSQRWNGEKKDLEMVEDAPCQKVFPAFLRFLYCNHVVLHQDNCLPILILADKYNVISLKKSSRARFTSTLLPKNFSTEIAQVLLLSVEVDHSDNICDHSKV
ncbi:BTB/POZ domain protein [Ancylostoma ceylanicum]|uniref:BTB/POZ domain protein n=1 Tax=Ancylostoma ceylanicum TaxID=53326 RepID=A0A0D6LW15_9BILA|nr:BTB/POZ domain protein [Ancylostoma ceylanicum]